GPLRLDGQKLIDQLGQARSERLVQGNAVFGRSQFLRLRVVGAGTQQGAELLWRIKINARLPREQL
ncbi:MAG TPA: hypothetical protein VIF33_03380, partial [Casimicrobiaceae bacterium]